MFLQIYETIFFYEFIYVIYTYSVFYTSRLYQNLYQGRGGLHIRS